MPDKSSLKPLWADSISKMVPERGLEISTKPQLKSSMVLCLKHSFSPGWGKKGAAGQPAAPISLPADQSQRLSNNAQQTVCLLFWFRITKYYQILTKCFGDDEVIQHWQQKLKWLSSCGLLWIYDPFLFSWSSSTKEKGRPYYTLGALLVSSRKSRHAWFTSTRDVMSPSPPREMDTVLPPPTSCGPK